MRFLFIQSLARWNHKVFQLIFGINFLILLKNNKTTCRGFLLKRAVKI